MLNPDIIKVDETLLVGMSKTMTLTENKTFDLFTSFMPLRSSVNNSVSNDVFEVCVYNETYFKNFKPSNTFTKWATIEVNTFDDIPNTMKTTIIKSGLYAKFVYTGLPQNIGTFMAEIFGEWLPNSKYALSNRPHFNILGKTYKQNNPESEEAVYIPVSPKLL